MNRPEVRIAQSQQVETNNNPVDSWEAEQLLRKYGYQNTQYSSNPEPHPQENQRGKTFEEMVAEEEARLKEERMRNWQRLNGTKPVTFDGSNGYYTETKYGADDESGYGFKIEITTDMKIPKY